MRCPYCKSDDDRVIDSRPSKAGMAVRRRRVCNRCEKRYTTYEVVEESPLKVIKRDGTREPFDRQKILSVLKLAVRKRPVADEAIEQLVEDVEAKAVEDFEREVSARAIAEMVMERLDKLDKVAYLRYASEYRPVAELDKLAGGLRELFRRNKV